jgi:type VII secretion protein EccB
VQTRRDQVQAHRFVATRVQSALLQGEPDPAETPLRRIGVATFSSIMVAVLVIAGFGIFGLLRPGEKQGWTQPGTLIVEKETGSRFIYDPADGAVHPVLNYASARLILNTPTVTVRLFSRASLAAAPRGPVRGLAGLPDALPDSDGLVRGPWTICSSPPSVPDGAPVSTVSVGFAAAGEHVATGRALLVRALDQTTTGTFYLVWNDTRLEIKEPGSALAGLGYARAAAIDVDAAWINSVPPGPDLAAPIVPNLGVATDYQIGGQQVRLGQVEKVPAEGGVPDQYYLVLPDGLAQISATAALLLLSNINERRAYPGQIPVANEIQRADISLARTSPTRVLPDGYPDAVPALVNPTAGGGRRTVCSAYTDTSGASTAVRVSLADSAPGVRAGSVGGGTVPGRAGQVVLPPGKAAVVRLLPHEGQASESLYLVTDVGAKYPVPSAEVLSVLGYGGVQPVPVPNSIVELVPTGPALDPARANVNAPVDSASVPSSSGQPGGGDNNP